jgi:heme exporter protein A
MAATVIETRGLTRRFAGLTALHGIDLSVTAGEAVALFGHNGAGKTTLLRLLAMLLRPSAGTVHLFGRAITEAGGVIRSRIGFLSHQSFLYPDLTPTENLEFYARMFGVQAVASRVSTLLEQVGLGGWAHRPVRTLSRGLEQRCAVARALLHEPALLLLDEPFTGLDVDAAQMLSDTLRGAHAAGTTLLMVTHDMPRGFDLCRRGIILARGRLVWDGSIAASERATFDRAYSAAARGTTSSSGHEGSADNRVTAESKVPLPPGEAGEGMR